jgi:hypothetical protein
MCFICRSQKEAIIFLYSINCLVFSLETEWDFCAVGSESANIFKVNFYIFG